MISWLILSVIIALAFFFFITGSEKGAKEVVIKPRSRNHRKRTDTEFGEETDLWEYFDLDYSEYINKDEKKIVTKQQNKILNQQKNDGYGERRKNDMETGEMQKRGNIYDLKLKPKKENDNVVVKGKKESSDSNSSETTNLTATEKSAEGINIGELINPSAKINQEFDEEVGKDLNPDIKPPLTLLEYDPEIIADHIIQVGGKPEYVPGHKMPIHLELQPFMIAFPKDPYWAHVSWVLPENYPEGQLELKIKNLTQQIEFFQPVNFESRSWYLYLNQPNQKFSFELGVRDPSGNYKSILHSNEIKTPADRPSNILDDQWLAIEEFYQKRMVVSPEGSPEYIMEIGGKLGGSEQLFRG